MKKTIVATIVSLVLACSSGNRAFPEVPAAAGSGWSFGGGTSLESWRSGGLAELGFALVEGGSLSVRNYVAFSGWGLDGDGGALVLTDKIAFGGFAPSGSRSYAWIEGGAGLFARGGKSFLDPPLVWDAKGGGGIEFFQDDDYSFYAEIGGGAAGPAGDSPDFPDARGFALIRLGFRRYF